MRSVAGKAPPPGVGRAERQARGVQSKDRRGWGSGERLERFPGRLKKWQLQRLFGCQDGGRGGSCSFLGKTQQKTTLFTNYRPSAANGLWHAFCNFRLDPIAEWNGNGPLFCWPDPGLQQQGDRKLACSGRSMDPASVGKRLPEAGGVQAFFWSFSGPATVNQSAQSTVSQS